MFNNKKVEDLEIKVNILEKYFVTTSELNIFTGKMYYSNSIIDRLNSLEKENIKLKAIIAELVDYVYGDKK